MTAIYAGPGLDLKFVSTGMTAKMGGYMPMRAEMGTDEAGIKVKPSGLKAPSYGSIALGDKKWAFILEEPDGADATLYVDSNQNGDLTDDPKTKWALQAGNKMYFGSADLKIGTDTGTINLYRFDKNDPQRANLKNTLLFYPDFGYQGKGKIGKNEYTISFPGLPSATSWIWIDRNNDGKLTGRAESFTAGKPFNLGGSVFEFKLTDGKFEAVPSTAKVDEIPLPPDLGPGKPAIKFESLAMDGSLIKFPETYKGKIVLLDFWATWCGPCIAEMPNVIDNYTKYHDKGFEILGISFDQKDADNKINDFIKEHKMPWKQVYEGKYWDTVVGKKYAVEGIPFAVLVDGDTGKIIASGNALRGSGLGETLEKAIKAKATLAPKKDN